MSFSFSRISKSGDIVEVLIQDDDVTWDELAHKFQQFLLGCGFLIDPVKVDFAEILWEAHEATLDNDNGKLAFEFTFEEYDKRVAKKAAGGG